VSVDLATASYRSFHPIMGVPVQTSIGRPRFPLRYELADEVRALMPWGLFGKGLAPPEFVAHYRARLNKTGVDKLRRVFYAISAKHEGARLVLLCFERPDEFCHRHVFGRWWEDNAGQPVVELSTLSGEAGVPVVVSELEGHA
jgi:hypothetical protein